MVDEAASVSALCFLSASMNTTRVWAGQERQQVLRTEWSHPATDQSQPGAESDRGERSAAPRRRRRGGHLGGGFAGGDGHTAESDVPYGLPGAFLTFEDGEPGEAGTGEALQETLFLQRSAAGAGPKLRAGLQGGGNVAADGIAAAVIVLQYI
ncbi:hypothetical protein [Microbispora bryophytorum]|uniref:hypothetical protein n=1 Tax=Microbispora bryophytorum TaxID=1460882 RepID=UPI0033C7D2D9